MTNLKTALIIGISGQDGAYLAKFLLQKKYEVHGTSRNHENNNFTKLTTLGIRTKVKLHSMSISDFESVYDIVNKVKPDEIYNLAGVSSVSLSFQQVHETFESIIFGTINILEVLKILKLKSKYFNAGSTEIYGNATSKINEKSPANPLSPYAIAKSCSHNIVVFYRKAYKIFASNGVLTNHESELRPDNFVIKKLVNHVKNKGPKRKVLSLGNIDITRDWGYAPEFCEGMWRILQHQKPDDFIIATAQSVKLRSLIKVIARISNQKIKIKQEKNLYRPLEISKIELSNNKIKKRLRWKPKISGDSLIRLLLKT
jgi:GDPmannose 4,6-dehydratase